MKTIINPPRRTMLLGLIVVFVFGGCARIERSLPRYATVRQLEAAQYNVGATPEVAVVEVEGGRRDLQDAVVEALIKSSREGGFFIVEDRKAEGIRFDIRDGQPLLTGKQVSTGENDVFVKVTVLDSYAEDGYKRETRKTGLFNSEEEIVEVVETKMLVAFTVMTADELLMDQKEYMGTAKWRLGEQPSDKRTRYDYAAAEAARLFLDDITPRYAEAKIKMDNSDEAQLEIIKSVGKGRAKEAEPLLRQYVAQHPNSASAWYNLGVVMDAQGEYEEALGYYDKAISMGGQSFYTDTKMDCLRRIGERGAVREASAAPASTRRSPVSAGGSNRAGLARAQAKLNEMGYDCGTADGIMGPKTRACLQAFQEASGLEPTGTLDETTYARVVELR